MKLRAPGWSGRTREGLEQLIESGAGRALPAVLDFDNTVICGDIGEAALAFIAREGIVRKGDIPGVMSPPFMSRGGAMVRLADCADITVYYEELLDATAHNGNDRAPLSNGYVWAVEIMQGMKALDVVKATERANALGDGTPGKKIEVTPGLSSYPVPFFYSQMVELIAALLGNGYDVWILSASNVWTVRWMVRRVLNVELAKYGCGRGIGADHVIGVSTLLADRDGRLHKDPLLVRSDPLYAGMDEGRLAELSLTGRLTLPVPVYSGKVANVMDLIGKRPYFAAGDSPGDLPMLSYSENRLWIARLGKPAYQREFAGRAVTDQNGSWLVQPAACDKEPGFIADMELYCGDGTPEPVAESAGIIRKFL